MLTYPGGITLEQALAILLAGVADAAKPSDIPRKDQHVVRVQSQGAGVEESESVVRNRPVMESEALAALVVVMNKTPRAAMTNERRDLFARAAAWIKSVAAAGGTDSPGRAFGKGNVHVDVENLRGFNLVPDDENLIA